jgi:membrane fusion protein (multidrug efflux system)
MTHKFNPLKHKSKLGLAFILMAAFAIQSCGSSEEKKEEKEKKADSTAAPVIITEAFPLQKGTLTSHLDLPGELTAFQQVDIYAKVSSFVKTLSVDVGSEVRAGQLLATMEAPELNSQLAGAQSRIKSQEAIYLSSKATYDRLLATSKTPGTISPNDLEIASAKAQSDLAQLDALKASQREVNDTRNYLEIRAPFSGVISARNVSAGAYVGPTGKGSDLPMFVLQQQDHLRLIVSVPDAYSGALKSDSGISFSVKSLPGQTFKAKVSRLAGALDLKLRSQHIEMDVFNSNKKLLPGMIAEVSIPLGGNDNTFVVPSTAVLNSTSGIFVIKVIGNTAKWVPIKPGRSGGGKTEIFGDVNANDTIVKVPTEELRDGSQVKNLKLTK